MNADLANNDPHERARMLIALSGPEGVSNEQHSWLAAHLESCPECRGFSENARETIHALRATPITAGAHLVSATQMRVRQRALELQRQQERVWVVSVCCAAVTLCAVFTTAVFWFGFGWLGEQMRCSPPLWQASFALFSIMPAVLTAILLLARGTHLADRNGASQG